MATLSHNSAEAEGTNNSALLQDVAIDPSSLLTRLKKTDNELMKEIVHVFLREEPQQRRNIMRAILGRDRQLLATAAHSLRGSLCIFGADQATLIAERVETAARTIDFGDAYCLFERLESELDRLTRSLKILVFARDRKN